ncbi:MAG: sugar phosphate isomerase/epimerase [Thermoleophilia bacterium]|nr:sugar phosphate isomerase/epimerase [Thermoleophilia bacterium]
MLFDTDEHGNNLPNAWEVIRLRRLAEQHGLTYTVHLPLDLRLSDDFAAGDRLAGGELSAGNHISLVKARRAIDATRDLDPFAYTLHLDGQEFLGPGGVAGMRPEAVRQWQTNGRRALELVCSWVPDPGRLSVENVEAWDPEVFAPVVAESPVARTIDVGHLWLQQVDPMDHLERWIDRARVVHLHGIAERDHASLALIPPERLDPVVDLLVTDFSGVVTLEVFDREDLRTSMQALRASIDRGTARRSTADV